MLRKVSSLVAIGVDTAEMWASEIWRRCIHTFSPCQKLCFDHAVNTLDDELADFSWRTDREQLEGVRNRQVDCVPAKLRRARAAHDLGGVSNMLFTEYHVSGARSRLYRRHFATED